jgi:transposase
MDKYIGIDVHAKSSTVAVIDAKGKRVGHFVVETTGQALIECLRMISGRKHVCLEEGTQSAWLFEILLPHADEVVVVGVQESRGPKSDERDAFALAEKLRIGAVGTRVFKEVGPYRKLRELARVHTMVVRDVVRVKSRIKALYRSRGLDVSCRDVYSEKTRAEYLERLPAWVQPAAQTLYAQYDGLEPVRKQAAKELVAESHRHAIAEVLETCPGMGPIRVAQLLPIVVVPERFRTKRQFWSYSGLGIVMRSSSDWVRDSTGQWRWGQTAQTRGLNFSHNRQLKAIFKGAATSVLSHHRAEPLGLDYQRLVDGGTKPNLAKVTIARKIAATVLAMWKAKEGYDPKKDTKPLRG